MESLAPYLRSLIADEAEGGGGGEGEITSPPPAVGRPTRTSSSSRDRNAVQGSTQPQSGNVNVIPPFNPVQTPIAVDIRGNPIPDNAIVPATVPPVSPGLQGSFLQWLQQQVGQGVPSYPGQLNPSLSSTRLPEVYSSWQPWDGGMGYLANFMAAGQQPSPILDKLMQYGGTGGYGHQGVSNIMNYGTPSSIGQFLSNMAQFGVASEGSGRPLANLAAGYASGPAAFLAPFLTGGGANPNYAAPPIPFRTPKIGQ